MWILGYRGKDNIASIRVTVTRFEGQVKIHVRHFLKRVNRDDWYSTKRGITLNLDEWDKFENFEAIDLEVRRIRSHNDQIAAVPPTGIKRDLQSAFGNEDE